MQVFHRYPYKHIICWCGKGKHINMFLFLVAQKICRRVGAKFCREGAKTAYFQKTSLWKFLDVFIEIYLIQLSSYCRWKKLNWDIASERKGRFQNASNWQNRHFLNFHQKLGKKFTNTFQLSWNTHGYSKNKSQDCCF